MFQKVYIPYSGYYSSAFCRWQGSLQNQNAIELGAKTARSWFQKKEIDPTIIDYLYFGNTVAQHKSFHSHNWASAMITENKKFVPGLFVHQACTTSATCVYLAALNVESDVYKTGFALMSDRCSNGPHTIWPNPPGPGGEVISENWNMDNMNADPNTGYSMTQTGENVAKEIGATKEEADAVTKRRYEQYLDALKDDRAFQKKYMMPMEIPITRKKTITVDADEGTNVFNEKSAQLKPVLEGGIHTYASQTHPADGNVGIIVTTRDHAKELSADKNIEVQLISYGFAREKPGFMPAAPVPATKMALERSGLKIGDIKAIKTHNPFAINDINLSKKMNIDVMSMNNYGSSIIWGHPQGPTAGRLIIELIEEMVLLGGGYGLYAGCAAGDTAAAVIVKVG